MSTEVSNAFLGTTIWTKSLFKISRGWFNSSRLSFPCYCVVACNEVLIKSRDIDASCAVLHKIPVSYYLSLSLHKTMIRLLPVFLVSTGILFSCNDSSTKLDQHATPLVEMESTTIKPGPKHFTGAFSNGMKGDSISFDISADGNKLSNLTFKGYWRCSGKLESVITGPEGAFTITNNKVDDHISEPPNGGATAWRYHLEAAITGNTAKGSFRMNINNLGCDSYKLMWTATAK
jgi:hypothetical protein